MWRIVFYSSTAGLFVSCFWPWWKTSHQVTKLLVFACLFAHHNMRHSWCNRIEGKKTASVSSSHEMEARSSWQRKKKRPSHPPCEFSQSCCSFLAFEMNNRGKELNRYTKENMLLPNVTLLINFGTVHKAFCRLQLHKCIYCTVLYILIDHFALLPFQNQIF